MLILVTRAFDEAQRTAARLTVQGHETVVSPVIEIVPTGASWPEGLVNGVIATSARAFELFSAPPDWPLPEARRLMPLLLVGARTEGAARERGFGGPAVMAPCAAELGAKIEGSFSAPCRFVYLAGRDRRPDLENKLAELGHIAEVVEVYAAQPAESLTREAVQLAEAGKIAAVLHYSRRSAEIYLRLAEEAGLDVSRVSHVCISASAAAPLLSAGINEVLVAKAPNEEAMFGIISALAGLQETPLGQSQNLSS